MRLSRFTDIGLRAVMYLGAHPGERLSARAVADAFGVSKDHVMKSLQALGALGVVDAEPGRNGGFALVRDPSTLRLGVLVAELEPSMDLAECFGPASTCPLTASCGLAGALDGGRRAFLDALDRYTVADLVAANAPRLVELTRA